MTRELYLLTPFRLPTHHQLTLNADDVATFLNGYLALWHPAALRGAAGPPKISSPYDHEQPKAGHVYAAPEQPPLFLPENWHELVRQAGAVSFRATPDREETVRNLLEALGAPAEGPAAGPYQGLGYGYLLLEALYEAMNHLPQLSVTDFWLDVNQALAAADEQAELAALKAAAGRLREAREVVYPANIYLLDLVRASRCRPDRPPAALTLGTPVNIIGSAQRVRTLLAEGGPWRDLLGRRWKDELVEVCGGVWRDRPETLLPLESQIWNRREGRRELAGLLGGEPQIFATERFTASPQTPQLVNLAGYDKAAVLPLDEGVLPTFRAAVAEWTSADGRRLTAFVRKPLPAAVSLTWFHLAHHLSQSLLHDMTASLAVLHDGPEESPWYRDWLELQRLAPVFGQLVTLRQFLYEVTPGEYPPPFKADDFQSDDLHELTSAQAPDPVSRFARHARRRRAVDAAATVLGLHRGLSAAAQVAGAGGRLEALESDLERHDAWSDEAAHGVTAAALVPLAERLLSRAAGAAPGFLVVNPCSFARRIPLELEGVKTPLPAPARATQVEGDRAAVVVDVPALGFAWLPRAVAPGTKVPHPKTPLVEGLVLQNEFLQAEIDPETGGLRALKDAQSRFARLAQRLVYGPGSQMRAAEVKAARSGPAAAEIRSQGVLVGSYDQELARFRQLFRLWRGRAVLELHIELEPVEPPAGYPWYAYFGSRFAWRDERAALVRGVGHVAHRTAHSRPETPDYLEVREGSRRSVILTGGLPFLQRQGQRMVDVVLLPEGESCRSFVLGIGVDVDEPVQAAQELVTPPLAVPVDKGPPHVGVSGWLAHVDMPNVLLTSLHPADPDAVLVHLVECRGVATQAELHFVRNPARAFSVDERGERLTDLPVQGDAVALAFGPGEILAVRVEFS